MYLSVSIGRLQAATGLIGIIDFHLDPMINHRYLYVTGFAKTDPNGTRTEIQITA